MPVLSDMALTEAESCEGEELQHNSGPDSVEINDHVSDEEINNDESTNDFSEISVPKVAVPEKIILCIDISIDENDAGYFIKNSTGPSLLPSLILKEALTLYITNKMSLHQNTQFAVIVVKSDEVEWASNFTNNPQKVINFINNLEFNSAENIQSYDLTPVFQKIYENIILPKEDCPIFIPPPEIYHVIFIYNSSKHVPTVDLSDQSYKHLKRSPYFVLDILYLHEKQSEDNNCSTIFNNLAKICKNTSYIFEASRSVIKVHHNLAKLLPHPLQRVHLQEL